MIFNKIKIKKFIFILKTINIFLYIEIYKLYLCHLR
jgi:hypothetical protein